MPGLIEELGRLGTRAVIVMTAGLSAAQKQATLDAARPHVLRVLGPNCLGLLTPHLGLNASFAHTDALAGAQPPRTRTRCVSVRGLHHPCHHDQLMLPRDAPSLGVPMHQPHEIASKLLGVPYEALDERAQRVARHIAERTHIARNVARDLDAKTPLGQRAADAVASFGGSWTFVGLFAATLLLWVGLNAFLLMRRGSTFDPYPYILLNLFLSMLAAIQAPVILMSQNRQSDKDRVAAEHDYEVNLKAELEIMLLHDKIDLLREKQWGELLEFQKEQLKLLAVLVDKKTLSP